MQGFGGKQAANLSDHRGNYIYSAHEALLKGILEADSVVDLLATVEADSFRGINAIAETEGATALLREHQTTVEEFASVERALQIAMTYARDGRRSVVTIPNRELPNVLDLIHDLLPGEQEQLQGGLCLVLEDDPVATPQLCPREAMLHLNVACLEAGDLDELRNGVDIALRLSRAGNQPVALVTHELLWRSIETLEAQPNRVGTSVETVRERRGRRPRRPRTSEAGGLMRMARRLELNRAQCLPNPGERVPVGFITIGPATPTLQAVIHEVRLVGRVPALQLTMLSPLDDAVIERMLTRCKHVIVLEPRPGCMERQVIAQAELLRQRGVQPGAIWGAHLPEAPDDDKTAFSANTPEDSKKVRRVERGVRTNEVLHPSVLARRIIHVLHWIRPTQDVRSHLLDISDTDDLPQVSAASPFGFAQMQRVLVEVLQDVERWLRSRTPQEDEEVEPTSLAVQSTKPMTAGLARVVRAEIWDQRRFVDEGIHALRHVANMRQPWLVLLCDVESGDPQETERLIRGAIPGRRADRVQVNVVNIAERVTLREALREAVLKNVCSLFIIRDGPPAQFDGLAIERQLEPVDALGFQQKQRINRPAEDLCAIRSVRSPAPTTTEADPVPLQSARSHDRFQHGTGPWFGFRIRPLREQIEVIRTKPPVSTAGLDRERLAPPKPRHAEHAQWRAHLSGYRGEPPGVITRVLAAAGERMGYVVRCEYDPMMIAPRCRASASLLFTRAGRGDKKPAATAQIPFGEADLLLGLDPVQVAADLRQLHIADEARTCIICNETPLAVEQLGVIDRNALRAMLRRRSVLNECVIEDYLSESQAAFLTDRLADAIMLGVAYQRGLIPLTLESLESALQATQQRSAGRLLDAFGHGRRLAAQIVRTRRPTDDTPELVDHIVRRIRLYLHGKGFRGQQLARRFDRLVTTSLQAMPGLTETDSGRQARRDFVFAVHHCIYWGGFAYAEQFAERVVKVYESDRGDTGRALTRDAILPLAQAMLIRDHLFIASMSRSIEQRRQIRRDLNVRAARGDLVERRYLTRFELVLRQHRFRFDVRTSDWPARLAALFAQRVPKRFRGTANERAIRDLVIDTVEQAASGAMREYDKWSTIMHDLHELAVDDTLRSLQVTELQRRVDEVVQT